MEWTKINVAGAVLYRALSKDKARAYMITELKDHSTLIKVTMKGHNSFLYKNTDDAIKDIEAKEAEVESYAIPSGVKLYDSIMNPIVDLCDYNRVMYVDVFDTKEAEDLVSFLDKNDMIFVSHYSDNHITPFIPYESKGRFKLNFQNPNGWEIVYYGL